MARLILELETITPLITKGAGNDPKNDPAELRAPPFRGMFRYWLRALIGTRVQADIDELRKQETAVFGSAQRGSSVSLMVLPLKDMRSKQDQEVLPVQTSKGYSNTFHAFPPGSQFQLIVQSHPLGDIPVPLLLTMLVAFRLGSLGRRARRGGGSLRVRGAQYDPEVSDVEFKTTWYTQIPDDQGALADFLQRRLATALKDIPVNEKPSRRFSGLPSYPVLLPEHACVLVGPVYSSARKALDVMWNIRKKSTYHNDPAFGKVNPRIPSTVHMRVNISQVGYHPVMTIFRTGIPHIPNWEAMQQFIDECTSQHGFTRVFGEGRWT